MKECVDGSFFFELDECIPDSISGLPAFLESFQALENVCHRDGSISTVELLESLRYCDTYEGQLIIDVSSPEADFTVLRDFEIVTGLMSSLGEGEGGKETLIIAMQKCEVWG